MAHSWVGKDRISRWPAGWAKTVSKSAVRVSSTTRKAATSASAGRLRALSHDGKTDGTEYYSDHGTGDISWGPLMCTGYSRNFVSNCPSSIS